MASQQRSSGISCDKPCSFALSLSLSLQAVTTLGFVFDSALEPTSVVRFQSPRRVHDRQRECFSFDVRMSSQRHAHREHHPLPCPSVVRRFCLPRRISMINCRSSRAPVSVPCHTSVPTRTSPRVFRYSLPFSTWSICLASFRF